MRVCVLALVLLAGCAPTILRVESEPEGADVHEETLGYLGSTPLNYTFQGHQLERLENARNLQLTIEAAGYVPWQGGFELVHQRQVTLKRSLTPARDLVTVTSDPQGAHVFALVIDTAVVRQDEARNMTYEELGRVEGALIRRYLGATPVELRTDAGGEQLRHNTPLDFELAGYEPGKGVYKTNEPRVHVVLRPTNAEAR